ncbi:hypothetical protein BSI_04840 [Bacillus inaquosorum KCTC 13429]|uniref:Uncharacterized protein n=1 Tax=Bacillus inaquosorum KCTC 13429 TaxID=1236548 RepID=A0A9W5PEM3_9BACI|nr:hypothetical protein BSI_04840 [Bacillus inaquosorum KCTC 13429]
MPRLECQAFSLIDAADEFILREIKSKKLDLLLFDIFGAPAEL